jgi:hypothetical protein
MLPRTGRAAKPGRGPAVLERVESSLALESERKRLRYPLVTLAIRILRWVVGLLLISTVLLKEDSERRVQSRVETLWLRLAYGQDVAVSRATAFLRVLARLTGAGFDRLFGKRLISIRGLCVSVCYSIASCKLAVLLLTSFYPHPAVPISTSSVMIWVRVWSGIGMFLFLGSLPAFFTRELDSGPLLWFWEASVFVVLLLGHQEIVWIDAKNANVAQSLEFFAVLFTISSVSDFFYIGLTRWMLRKASELTHAFGILGIVLLDCTLGIFLFVGPFFLGRYITFKLRPQPGTFSIAAGVWAIGPFMNTIDVLACSLFLVLMVVMLLHSLLWPILEGPVYLFQRFGLIKRKGWLVLAGASLILGKTIWSIFLEVAGKL